MINGTRYAHAHAHAHMPMPIQRAAVRRIRHCPSGGVSLRPNDRGHTGSVTEPAPPKGRESGVPDHKPVSTGAPHSLGGPLEP